MERNSTHILICIDDTDNLESIGTGEVLENLCAGLRKQGLAASGFITRHQLYIHEDIAYTSHNSSMCCEAETDDLENVLHFCRRFMDTSCAEGSDPGLCIVNLDHFDCRAELISFGRAAKNSVLKKRMRNSLQPAALNPSTCRSTGAPVTVSSVPWPGVV